MIDPDEYYRKIHQRRLDEEAEDVVDYYNTLVDIVAGAITLVVAQVRADQLPAECSWIESEGAVNSCWQLYRAEDKSYATYLLAREGHLVKAVPTLGGQSSGIAACKPSLAHVRIFQEMQFRISELEQMLDVLLGSNMFKLARSDEHFVGLRSLYRDAKRAVGR